MIDLWLKLSDEVRRAQATGLCALGYGPEESIYDIIASSSLWQLRRYAGGDTGPCVLIVAAPIKRPYIWDLTPSVSAVRFCLEHGLRIYLLEWRPPSGPQAESGLAEYAKDAIAEAVAAVAREVGTQQPFLMGHSLGGTLAAIFASLRSECLSGLVLLSAPLCLHPGVSRFRDTLAAMPLAWPSGTDIIPGSFLSQLSAMASPSTFIWSRLLDAADSAKDPRASNLRPRIEQWALDEVALSGKLFREIFLWIYRGNRFCNGTLEIAGQKVDPSSARAPLLAVANAADEIAPPPSVIPFLEAASRRDAKFIEYSGEPGVVLQHLGILVGRDAFTRIWPEIVSWLWSHS